MRHSVTAIALAAVISAGSPAAVAANASVVIGAFTVTKKPFPAAASLKKPQFRTNTVEIGTNITGASPYAGTPLAGSPFISIQPGGVAAFLLRTPSASVSLIWSTPGVSDHLTFFDTHGRKLGTLGGSDILSAFGDQTQTYRITAASPIGTVIAEDVEVCCFEFGNDKPGG